MAESPLFNFNDMSQKWFNSYKFSQDQFKTFEIIRIIFELSFIKKSTNSKC